jgi:pimeloyl-ACP methyl ester carboxylesterase
LAVAFDFFSSENSPMILATSLTLGLTLGLVSWLGLSPRVSPFIYNRFIFQPQRSKGLPEDICALLEFHSGDECFFLNDQGNLLHGWLFGSNQNDDAHQDERLLLYSMGKDGDIARRATMLNQFLNRGFSIFIYEYRGYGQSQGRPSLDGMVNDAVSAYDFVTQRLDFKPEQIVLFGESLGGAISSQLALKREAAGLVLKSTFASLNRIARKQLPLLHLYPDSLMAAPSLDNTKAIAACTMPVLVVHGEADRMVPVSHARLLAAQAGESRITGKNNVELVILPQSRHGFMSDKDSRQFENSVVAFVEKTTRTKK